jgi:nucleotidyltransferase/DNA polymerase involved in DNA repair
MRDRTIFHIDMDAFFASIEIVRNPTLAGKPVIVGGQPNTRGVVSTCSYEARVFGVHSAMSLTEAFRKCPHGIFLDGNFALYRSYSHAIMAIFQTFTPHLEVVSVDEAYLDVSHILNDYQSVEELIHVIHDEVLEKIQLSCSMGIGSNKLIAKIASSKAKPNGFLIIPAGQEEKFLSSLPIQALPGVGEKTQIILNKDGIKNIQDMQSLSLDELIQRYGSSGYHFFMISHGRDYRPVEQDDQPPKSIGADTTFERDVNEREFCLKILQELVEKTCKRLRNHKMRAKSVTLKLRFSDFKTISRSKGLFSHTNQPDEIFQELVLLFDRNYTPDHLPLRMVGVALEKLTNGYWQPTLWDIRHKLKDV